MTIKTLLLVGALSLAAASGVQAGGHSTSGDFRGHANAPACDTDRCPVLAGGASGIGGDIRTSLIDKTRSGQIRDCGVRCWPATALWARATTTAALQRYPKAVENFGSQPADRA